MAHVPKFGCGAEGFQKPSKSTPVKNYYNCKLLYINELLYIYIKSWRGLNKEQGTRG